jgi:acetoin utilization deacetylase AcuC-like enzyme
MLIRLTSLRWCIKAKVAAPAGGRLVLLLEGGYSFQGLSEGVCNSFQALTGGGKPLHDISSNVPLEPTRAVDDMLDEVVDIHRLGA